MIMRITTYIGESASKMLGDMPFKLWPFERTSEDGLNKPIIQYVFPNHGVEIRCDDNEEIVAIFLYADKFDETLFNIPFTFNRGQIFEMLGAPVKSGDKVRHPMLGEYGAWDRFEQQQYVVHIQYHVDCDSIKMITLMSPEVAP